MRKPYNFGLDEVLPPKTVLEKIIAYKNYWIGLGIGLVALGIFYVGLGRYNKFQEMNCQKAYRNADTEAKKRAFAYNFLGRPLAGKVALELADKLYVASKYEEALKLYDIASSSLAKTPLIGRAYLGEAMCLVQDKKISEAEKVLKKLMKNSEALGALKAEAALQALLLAIRKKDPEAIQKYKEELEGFAYSDIVKERMRLIEASSCNP